MKNYTIKKTQLALLLIPLCYGGEALAVFSSDGTTLSSNETVDSFYLSPYDPLLHNRLEIKTTQQGGTTPLQGYGLYNFGDNLLTTSGFKSIYIETTGDKADGIMQRSSKVAVIGDYLEIKTTGSSSDGINLAVTGSSDLTIGNNLTVYTEYGDGVRSNLSTAGGSNILTIGADAAITTNGTGGNFLDSQGYAVYAGNRDIETVGTPNANTAKITIGDDSNIITNGNNAYAVFANKTGVIQLGSTTITTDGQNAHGIVAQDGSILYTDSFTSQTYKGGQVYLTDDTTVSVDTTKGSYAMYSSGDESLISSSYSDGSAASGVYTIKGNIIADKQGKIDLTATNGSAIISTIDNNSTGANAGVINLSMSGANSQWKLTASSYLNTLNLTSNAKVSFGYAYATPTSQTAVDSTNAMILTTTDLSGTGGLFEMRTVIDGSSTYNDLLKVTGTSQGAHQIKVNDSGTGTATGLERITLVETADGIATFTLSSAHSGGTVDVGAYNYELGRGDTTLGERTSDWILRRGSKKPTNTASNSINILNTNYLMSYIETQTLLQRMGQLRQSEGDGGDTWGRIYGGKLNSFSGNNLSGFGLDYYGIQLGVDRKVDNDSGNDIYYGIMGSMTQGNVDYSVGDGKIKSYTIGIYGSYQNEDGFYIDGILKYVKMDNKFNTKTGGGYAVKGSGDSKGFSIGAEVGQRFYLDFSGTGEESAKHQGWYLEPQGQVTYSHQGDVTIKASNGLRTDLDSYNSLLGRATIIAGYTIVDNENPIDIYLKTGFLKEFKGETSYTFNRTDKNKYDFDGQWWDNGIGINMQLNKQHNLYADAVYAVGNKFDQKQINLGYRYSF